MKKVTIIGHFGGDKKFVDGQTVKTKITTSELKKIIGDSEVNTIDTYNWRKKPLNLVLKIIQSFRKSKNIIILTAHNGLKIFIPLCVTINLIYNRKIHYSVIGGWLPSYLKENKWLNTYLNKVDNIYVETRKMKKELEYYGYKNIHEIPNFKNINIIDKPINIQEGSTYKVCTFSRVNKDKGIEDLCIAIEKINMDRSCGLYQLDVFGPVEDEYIEEFDLLKKKYSKFMRYKGVIESDKSVEVISKYYMLIFPTKYKTEGIPGTIIDAYASGVPVIVSRWESYSEILKENITGISYEFNNIDNLVEKLEIAKDKILINSLRENCIEEARRYMPQYAISKIVKLLD